MTLFRNTYARPMPPQGPRQAGERCELSDLLVSQCACRVHKPEEPEDKTAHEQDLDFS